MTKRIPKVGDVYKCLDGSCRTAKTGELVRIVDVDAEDTFATYRTIEKNGQSHWSYEEWPEDFEYVSSGQQFEGKHFINVKAYAEKYIDQVISDVFSCPSKPPLGLQPWNVHDNLRVQDILAAIQRYVVANKAVPNEWLEELINKLDIDHE